jgi:glyoxylase-like metal-dependent hydrolase (beta-lactamase superfamily II)
VQNQTVTLGDFELTAISDGTYVADGGAFFGVVPKVMWEKKVRADELNRITVSCNSVLVRTGKQNILIETGIGNKLDEKKKKIFQVQEKLLQNLQSTGVPPEKIDIVINSHLHFDHCGWNTVYRNDGRRVEAWIAAAGARPRKLSQPQLRSTDPIRPDAAHRRQC